MHWTGSWGFWAPVHARPLTHAVTFHSFPGSAVSPLNDGSHAVLLQVRPLCPMPLLLASLLHPKWLCTGGLPASPTGSRRRVKGSVQGSRLMAAHEPPSSTPQCQQVTPQPLEHERKGAGGVQRKRHLAGAPAPTSEPHICPLEVGRVGITIPASTTSETTPPGRVPGPRSQSESKPLGCSLGRLKVSPPASLKPTISNRKLGPEPFLFQGHKPV